jgi:hypothetical protein
MAKASCLFNTLKSGVLHFTHGELHGFTIEFAREFFYDPRMAPRPWTGESRNNIRARSIGVGFCSRTGILFKDGMMNYLELFVLMMHSRNSPESYIAILL